MITFHIFKSALAKKISTENHNDEVRKYDVYNVPTKISLQSCFEFDISYYDEILNGFNLFALCF